MAGVRSPASSMFAKLIVAGLVVCGVLLPVTAAHAGPLASSGFTQRVSVDTDGNVGTDLSETPAMSSDGRFVAFTSLARDLVPDQVTATPNVFLRDRQTNTTQILSVDSLGGPANGGSDCAAISDDGRYVAFRSSASDLVPGANGGVFVRDIQSPSIDIEVADVPFGGGASNGFGGCPAISGDGQFVAFGSTASDLVPGDTNGLEDVFVRDMFHHITYRIAANSSSPVLPSITPDGQYVLFNSPAADLVPGDTNGVQDFFVVHDWTSPTPTYDRVSVDSSGAQANGGSFDADISDDGNYVVFDSIADNLVPSDSNGTTDVFLHERGGATQLVSVDGNGVQGNDMSYGLSISGDGSTIAFGSNATNLVPGDTNGSADIFVRSRSGGSPTRASVDSSGQQGNQGAFNGDRMPLSYDGSIVAFSSFSSNLAGDTADFYFETPQVYVRDMVGVGDVTPPTVKSIDLSVDPVTQGGSSLLSVRGSDAFGVVRTEYFVDSDPGAGSGISLQHAASPNFDPAVFSGVVPANLPIGAHVLGVRTMDAAGQWSVAATTTLTVSALGDPQVAQAFVVPGFSKPGRLSTDPGHTLPTSQVPVRAEVELPQGRSGPVTITTSTPTASLPGYTVVGQQADITAPSASPDNPLTLTFQFHPGILPNVDVQAFKNGVLVPDCSIFDFEAIPDPCVFQRDTSRFIVLSTDGGNWVFAVTGGDTVPPTITLTTPPDGVQYTQGQVVHADYTCQDEVGGSGIASCVGSVANGADIDTSTIGTNQTFTVDASDVAGNSAVSVIHHYSVVAAPLGVASVAPSSIGQGASRTLTVNGSGFVNGATLSIVAPAGGITITGVTSFVDSTHLSASFSATGSAAVGTPRTVRVTNPGGAFVNCPGCLNVNVKPTFTSLTSVPAHQGMVSLDVAIAGTGFQPGAQVVFSGTGVTVNSVSGSGTTLSANITIDVGATAGARGITITNPDGGSVTKANAFAVNALPTITSSLNPASRGQGVTAAIVITGSGFPPPANFLQGGGQVSFGVGITVNSVTRNTATKLTANISVSPSAAPGSRSVTVTNPDGGSVTCASCFSVGAAPTITSPLSPNSRPVGASQQSISVTGTGFQSGPTPTAAISGAGVTVTAVTFNDSTSITLTINVAGGALPGARNLTVTNPDGGAATCIGCFTVNAKPTIVTLNPTQIHQGTTALVTMTGTGFQSGPPDPIVTFSGTGVTATVVSVSATTITLSVTVTPNAAKTNRNVMIVNPDGGPANKSGVLKVVT